MFNIWTERFLHSFKLWSLKLDKRHEQLQNCKDGVSKRDNLQQFVWEINCFRRNLDALEQEVLKHLKNSTLEDKA